MQINFVMTYVSHVPFMFLHFLYMCSRYKLINLIMQKKSWIYLRNPILWSAIVIQPWSTWGWRMSNMSVPFQMMLNLCFSFCCLIYCNFNLLPSPEAYTTVWGLIIPIWRKVPMNQLFTRLNIKMAHNKIFAAFTDVTSVAQQHWEKKRTENAALQ